GTPRPRPGAGDGRDRHIPWEHAGRARDGGGDQRARLAAIGGRLDTGPRERVEGTRGPHRRRSERTHMTTPPRLVIRDTDGSERTIELRDGVMRIGRSADNEIVLGDASKGVSRAHAELHVENGRCTIVDLHSQNGTWLNALRVQRPEVRPGPE